MRNFRQRLRFLQLGYKILKRKTPLGVGLKKQCYMGLAIEEAKNKNVLEFFGISFQEMKEAIK